MKYLFSFVILFYTFCLQGQDSCGNAWLYRKHIDKDSIWIVKNTNCYYISHAGMRENNAGWLFLKRLQMEESDLLYFDAQTSGSVKLVFEIPTRTQKINFDTLSRKNYHLINHFYGYARTDFEKTGNTVDILSGTVSFLYIKPGKIVLDGIINIDTKNPITHQEIGFRNFSVEVQTLSAMLERERQEELDREREQEKQRALIDLVANERRKFYDSVFNPQKFSVNGLKARHGRRKFSFTLNNSYILSKAKLTDSTKHDLIQLLGGNIITSIEYGKNVFVLHAFDNPSKKVIDDETNYSLSIEVDSIVKGKTYQSTEINAKLVLWHYGPLGKVITSISTTGFLIVTGDDDRKTTGKLDLRFNNTDNLLFSVKGNFELPKLMVHDIVDLENRIKNKLLQADH